MSPTNLLLLRIHVFGKRLTATLKLNIRVPHLSVVSVRVTLRKIALTILLTTRLTNRRTVLILVKPGTPTVATTFLTSVGINKTTKIKPNTSVRTSPAVAGPTSKRLTPHARKSSPRTPSACASLPLPNYLSALATRLLESDELAVQGLAPLLSTPVNSMTLSFNLHLPLAR